MNPDLRMNRRFFPVAQARLIPILIGMCFLTIDGTAMQERAAQSECKQSLAVTSASAAGEQPIVVTIDELRKNREKYYGKIVTVDGEIHRSFTDNVFTIENNGFIKDGPDVLIISNVPKEEAVTSLDMKERAVERGKKVRVTGLVQPYDRGKLECAYGPLHLESREGHSFTRSPVLIVNMAQTAKTEMPPRELGKPSPAPLTPSVPEAAAPEPARPESAKPPEEPRTATLPKTASHLPVLVLVGLVAIFAAAAMRLRTTV